MSSRDLDIHVVLNNLSAHKAPLVAEWWAHANLAGMTPMAPVTGSEGTRSSDDPEGEREHGSGHIPDDPANLHHRQGRGQRADWRHEQKGDQDSDDNLLLADHIANTAQDGRGDGGAQQVCRQKRLAPALQVCNVCSSWGIAEGSTTAATRRPAWPWRGPQR
jgi:hypothetical protein